METANINFKHYEFNSIMKVGSIEVHNKKRFNFIERFMWKYLLGVEIINITKNER
jgi:hypothetical protein